MPSVAAVSSQRAGERTDPAGPGQPPKTDRILIQIQYLPRCAAHRMCQPRSVFSASDY